MTGYHWGKLSLQRLKLVHPHLIAIVTLALRQYAVDDLTIVEGIRDLATQRRYVEQGVSWTMNSRHLPQADGYSHAVDVAPLIGGRIFWDDWEAFKRMSGVVFQAANYLGYQIVWGGNWPTKRDGPHFQL
jgi:peptidoglycan L-alanyl-D-glutamate endopeptidase CwlK